MHKNGSSLVIQARNLLHRLFYAGLPLETFKAESERLTNRQLHLEFEMKRKEEQNEGREIF